MLKFPLPSSNKVMKFDILNKTDWRVYEAFIQNPGYTIVSEETHSLSPVIANAFSGGGGDDEDDKELVSPHQVMKIIIYRDNIIPKRKLPKC